MHATNPSGPRLLLLVAVTTIAPARAAGCRRPSSMLLASFCVLPRDDRESTTARGSPKRGVGVAPGEAGAQMVTPFLLLGFFSGRADRADLRGCCSCISRAPTTELLAEPG